MSGQIYVAKQAPLYRLGHAWSLACLVLSCVGWVIVRTILKKREAGKDKAIAEGVVIPPEDFSDRVPTYRYQI